MKATDPDRAKLINIRYTGLQAYSIMEGYERMKAGMRLYRAIENPQQSARESRYDAGGDFATLQRRRRR